jgi:hypothetical protein
MIHVIIVLMTMIITTEILGPTTEILSWFLQEANAEWRKVMGERQAALSKMIDGLLAEVSKKTTFF